MKTITIALVLLLICNPAFAAFGSQSQWDVQTGGADTNGIAFDPNVAAPGTDESTGAGTAITITLASGTTGTGSPVFSSTTHGPGNFVHIASGTGCTTGWFEILSQAAGVATFDHTMGSATNVCTGVIGGAGLTIQNVLNVMADQNTIWLKSGTYTLTTNVNSPGSNRTDIILIGYGSTHGDNGTKPLITTATNSTVLLTTANAQSKSFWLQNISFSNTAGTRASALTQGTNATYGTIVDCKFDGFNRAIDLSNGGVNNNGAGLVIKNTAFLNDQGSAVYDTHGTSATFFNDYFYSNVNGIEMSGDAANNGNGAYVIQSIFASNSGRGILLSPNQINRLTVLSSTFTGNTSDGIGWSSATVTKLPASNFDIEGNIFYNNGGWGLNLPASTTKNQIRVGNNAWGSNTLGNYTTSVPAGTGDQTLTADPFTSAAGQDYSLNNTAGGGALARATGIPGAFPAGSTTGFHDIGAVQVSDAGGGTSIYPIQ